MFYLHMSACTFRLAHVGLHIHSDLHILACTFRPVRFGLHIPFDLDISAYTFGIGFAVSIFKVCTPKKKSPTSLRNSYPRHCVDRGGHGARAGTELLREAPAQRPGGAEALWQDPQEGRQAKGIRPRAVQDE